MSDTVVRRTRIAATTLPRQVIPLDLALVARPPTVTSVTPANGAVNIALGDPVIVHFSSPIDPATATLQTIQLSSTSGIVLGTLALTSNNTTATFRPAEALQPNTAALRESDGSDGFSAIPVLVASFLCHMTGSLVREIKPKPELYLLPQRTRESD